MSKFKELVEKVLKETDFYNDMKYFEKNPDDHSGDDSIDWTLDLPLSNELAQIIVKNNLVGIEDLQDEMGNLLPEYQLDGKVEYTVEGYPEDEEINITNVYLNTYDETNPYENITAFLSPEYLQKLSTEIENSGKVDLNSIDPTIEWTKDYHNNLL